MKKLFLSMALALVALQVCLAQPTLYGMTSAGGADGLGTIFKIQPDGSGFELLHPFSTPTPGAFPEYGHLTKAANGKLYGMTSQGGQFGAGVLFEYEPETNVYTKKKDFNTTDGSNPFGSLTEYNGKLYGLASGGDSLATGVLFEYDPETNAYVKKKLFYYADGSCYPFGSLTEYNGKLYGFTGGDPWWGVPGILFEYDPATNAFETKKVLDNSFYGGVSIGSMTEYNDKLYGLTSGGGDSLVGMLFEYDPATNVYIKKKDFKGNDGKWPYGSLTEYNGKLYGMTSGGNVLPGAAISAGVIFEYDPATNTYIKLKDFQGDDGNNPWGSLTEFNGKLYGMTSLGGASGDGVLFEYDPATNVYIKQKDFSGSDGMWPHGSMTTYNDKLYGMTNWGGIANQGVIFEYVPATNIYTKKKDFNANEEGGQPQGSLTEYKGKLYGMVASGGEFNKGAIFEFIPATKAYNKKKDFNGDDGAYPYDNLTEFNGKLYGTTGEGGANNVGVIFEYDPTANVYTKKKDFSGGDGAGPNGSLTKYNGKLYGSTSGGGSQGKGVIFEYDPMTNVYTKKKNLIGTDGSNPTGGLAVFNDKLYGMNSNPYGGSLFEYDPATNAYTVKYHFSYTSGNGAWPLGSLTVYNGKLYGMTHSGGALDNGVIFEYDPTANVYTKKKDFNGDDGAWPFGSLTAYNGKLYGMTTVGGANIAGVLFEFDPATDAYVKYLDFDLINGAYPHGDLMVLDPLANAVETPVEIADLSVSPNPASDQLTIVNRSISDGCLSLVQADGRVVATLRLSGFEQKTVSVADISPGLLLWKWSPGCEGTMQTGRILILR
jgi:uncharacterized repeat protein (TIGR03803 family)